MTDIADWMEANSDQIPNFDTGRSASSQIDVLTINQIRRIARSSDPWAQSQP